MAKIIVETSARHVHLTRKDVDILFGAGHQLTKKKDLSQPGQFACEEKVTVVGERGQLSASILGPERSANQVELSLSLDGTGVSDIDTGCGFLDHMLTLFASHGRFDLTVKCKGDVYVDYHHTTEDIGIALGAAFAEALGDKKGIARYGFMILPMDEALVLSAVDVSGRTYLNFDVKFPTEKIGDFDCELVKEFFYGFVRSFPVSLHVKMFEGENSHHLAEAVFKSVSRSLRQAVAADPQYKDEIPSTKGTL